MATEFFFNNKLIKQPGTYAEIKSGVKNPPLALSFGNVVIIDTGSGSGYGGGAGINGTLSQEQDSIYFFNTVQDFRDHTKGGLWWLLAEPLFRPSVLGINGASTVYFIKAATTVPAEMSYTFTGGGPNGGTFTLQVRDEGLIGNGVTGDETLATAQYNVTNAGVGLGDTIELLADGVQIAIYENAGGENIQDMVNGLVASFNTIGTALGYILNTSDATSLTINAPKGTGVFGNNITSTTNDTGAAVSNATNPTFLGGLNGTLLTQGYAAQMASGLVDANKFILNFYVGTFVGLDPDGDPWNNIAELDTVPQLVSRSIEFDNIADLIDWMTNDFEFNQFFKLKESTINGDGSVDAADLLANSALNLAQGGTENYTSSDLDLVLDNIVDLDNTFFLADRWGDEATHPDNLKILAHIVEEARYEKMMFVGGGFDQSEFNTPTGSVGIAEDYNSDRVIVVHGGIKKAITTGDGFKERPSIYKATAVLGRTAGLEPQVPVTNKSIAIDGEVHELKSNERDIALDSGVLYTFFDSEFSAFVVGQGINTLQNNKFQVNEDGTTPSIQIRRIAAQLNKEILINSKVQLLGQANGVNFNTLSPEDVEAWLEGYLTFRTATDTVDNLIISYQDIVVSVKQDSYFIDYKFVPNFEITKLFFTGFITLPF